MIEMKYSKIFPYSSCKLGKSCKILLLSVKPNTVVRGCFLREKDRIMKHLINHNHK